MSKKYDMREVLDGMDFIPVVNAIITHKRLSIMDPNSVKWHIKFNSINNLITNALSTLSFF